MSKSNVHIVPSDGEWSVKRAGAERASRRFDTQQAAIDYGRKLARNDKVELLIHGRNGRIRARDSYGNDPFPPRG